MSAEQLEADVKLIVQRSNRKHKTAPKRSAKGLLANQLNPEAHAKLTALRFGR
jgi:hypothetical protein